MSQNERHTSIQWKKLITGMFPELTNSSNEEIIKFMIDKLGEDPSGSSPGLLSHHSHNNKEYTRYLDDLGGNIVYCKVINGTRTGTIGRLVKDIGFSKCGGLMNSNSWRAKIGYNPMVIDLITVNIKVNGRSRSWKQKVEEIEILEPGVQHETIFLESDLSVSSLRDKFGKQPEMGRFVIASDGDRLRLGTVQRIMPKSFIIGGETDKGRKWSHTIVNNRHDFIVVDNNLANDLLMYRLSM